MKYIKYRYTHIYVYVCMYSPRVCLRKTSVISSDNRDCSPTLLPMAKESSCANFLLRPPIFVQ